MARNRDPRAIHSRDREQKVRESEAFSTAPHDGDLLQSKVAATTPRFRGWDNFLHLPREESDYEWDFERLPSQRLGPEGRSDNEEVCAVGCRCSYPSSQFSDSGSVRNGRRTARRNFDGHTTAEQAEFRNSDTVLVTRDSVSNLFVSIDVNRSWPSFRQSEVLTMRTRRLLETLTNLRT
jgi:hypothetical protein